MGNKADVEKAVDDFFDGNYEITQGTVVPDVGDLKFGKKGREMELAMLFIDIRESTKIVDGFRRTTAAKMYKSFLYGVAKIAKFNNGELRSFNGDGVLVVFNGGSKRTNATKAAMQMSWFCLKVLKPKLDTYFSNNNQLSDLEFDFGIGIEVGKVLIVRGGIRGENNNDLVWVGNATNYAVKLSSLSNGVYHIYIGEDVYKYMNESSKFGGDPKTDMWERRIWTAKDDKVIYRTSWTWPLGD
jgi:class 3 adenylate cyclase